MKVLLIFVLGGRPFSPAKIFSAFYSPPPGNLSPAISISPRQTAFFASVNSFRRFIRPRPAIFCLPFLSPLGGRPSSPAKILFGVLFAPARHFPADRDDLQIRGRPPGQIKACPAGSVRIGLSQSQIIPRPSSCIPCGNPFGNCVMIPAAGTCHLFRRAGFPLPPYFPIQQRIAVPASGYRQIYAAFVLPPGIPAGRGIPSPAPRESAASARCGFWRNVVY